MNKKIFYVIFIISFSIISLCSYSLAATNTMNNIKNTTKNIGNAASSAKNTVAGTANNITSGATTLGKDTVNGVKDVGNTARTDLGTATGDYTATRTVTDTNSNLFGISNSAWTWLIMGIVGIIIVALVWFYGSQYEHKNYDGNE